MSSSERTALARDKRGLSTMSPSVKGTLKSLAGAYIAESATPPRSVAKVLKEVGKAYMGRDTDAGSPRSGVTSGSWYRPPPPPHASSASAVRPPRTPSREFLDVAARARRGYGVSASSPRTSASMRVSAGEVLRRIKRHREATPSLGYKTSLGSASRSSPARRAQLLTRLPGSALRPTSATTGGALTRSSVRRVRFAGASSSRYYPLAPAVPRRSGTPATSRYASLLRSGGSPSTLRHRAYYGTTPSRSAYPDKSWSPAGKTGPGHAASVEYRAIAKPSATEQTRRVRMRRLHKAWHAWNYIVSQQRGERLAARRRAISPGVGDTTPTSGDITPELRYSTPPRRRSVSPAVSTPGGGRRLFGTAPSPQAVAYEYSFYPRASAARLQGSPGVPHTPAAARAAIEGYKDPALRPQRRVAASHFHRMLTRRFFLAWYEITRDPHHRVRRTRRRRLTGLVKQARLARTRRRFLAWRRLARKSHMLRTGLLAFARRRSHVIMRVCFNAIRRPLMDKRNAAALGARADAVARRYRLARGLLGLRAARHRHGLMRRCIAVWRASALQRGLRVWVRFARHQRLLRHFVARWLCVRQGKALRWWALWAHRRAFKRDRMAVAADMWRGATLRRMLHRWAAVTDVAARRDEAIEAMVARRQARDVSRAFEAWQDVWIDHRRVKDFLESVLSKRDTRASAACFQAWQLYVSWRRAGHARLRVAVEHFRVTSMRRGLMAMLDRVTASHNRRRLMLIATGHADTALLHRCMALWRGAVDAARAEHALEATGAMAWRRRCLTLAVGTWYDFAASSAALRRAAQVAFGHFDAAATRRAFSGWRAYTQHKARRHAAQAAAWRFYEVGRLRNAVAAWYDFTQAGVRVRQIALLVATNHRLGAMRWSWRHLVRHTEARQARRRLYTDLTRQLQWRRARTLLARWKAWHQHRAQTRQRIKAAVTRYLVTGARRVFVAWCVYIEHRRASAARKALGARHFARRSTRAALGVWRRRVRERRLLHGTEQAIATLDRVFRCRAVWRQWQEWRQARRAQRWASAVELCDFHRLARGFTRLSLYLLHRRQHATALAKGERHFHDAMRRRALRSWRLYARGAVDVKDRIERAARLWGRTLVAKAFRTLRHHAHACIEIKQRVALMVHRSEQASTALRWRQWRLYVCVCVGCVWCSQW